MPFPPSPRPVFVFSAAKVVPFGLATIATSLVATSLTAVSLTAVSLTTAMTSPAIAQLIPDNTLGQESSVVTPAQLGQWQGDRIDGGAIRGSALFHSFEEFNVETGRAAYFANPAGIEAILGRVTGQNHSDISGRLGVLGNANLFLLNPNGIVFGPDASLDIRGSFAATTADTFTFADGQFFSAVDPEAPPLLTMNLTTPGLQYGAGQSGSIINAADLAVNAGETLTLTGETVVNTGRLTAPGGEVAIAAITGDTHIQLGQNGGIQEITSLDDLQRSPRSLPQSNVQTISDIVDSTDADLGLAMTADGRVMLTDSGTLIPTDPGDTVVSGSLDAANLNRGQRGGQVRVMGDRVALVDEAWVNVAGDRGGAQALIGGEYQGRGDRLNADQTYIGPETRILADAVTSGDGGRVILWADGNTRFYGEISARGGINGNGGFVEVSGKTSLTYRGTVTTSALGGNRGTLLLDPVNITIANGDGDGGIDDIDDGVLAGESPGEDITIFEATLEALAGETNVILEATNNITVEDLADDELLFQGGPGDLGEITLEADADGDGVGAFTMVDVMDTLITRGRSIEISGAELIVGNIDTEPDVNFAANDGGTIELIATNGDLTAGNLVASGIDGIGGNITLSANGGNVNLVDSQIISDTDLPLTGQGEEEFSQIAIGAFATSLTNPAAAPNGGLVLLDGARVSVENLFDGIAGDIFINAENGITITDSFLTANGNTGVIEIGITDVETVRAQETAIPQTVTITDSEFTSSNNNTGEGQAAGNISINANGSVSIINSNLSTNGNQGSIDIGISGNTRGVLQTVEVNDSSITAANKNPGEDQNAGNVAIAATNTISILNSSRLSTDGNLGTITLGVSEEFDGVPQTIAITDSRLTASSLNAESIA
ncbi:MAG: filamentous hemagglutinin N-terminal domain-containing protein, partial [Leptolyngbyaceae cyanobacterium]